jgi:hypothetical protein
VEDLLQLAIFAAILLLSLLGGAKKKADEQRRVQKRPHPTGPRPQPQGPTPPRTARPAPPPRTAERQRQEGLEAILDLLRGELPSPPEPEPDAAPTSEAFPDEARSLETLEPLGAASHRAFHERYIEPDLAPPPIRVSRYRLTPQTAREAVVWTAIFSPPKGLE